VGADVGELQATWETPEGLIGFRIR
jgi:hypothetical protein